jgi:toxin ParE1/3/4
LNSALDFLEHELIPLSVMPERAGDIGAKRIILRRFPYDLVVREYPDEYVVIAVAHHSRRPGYWQGRLRT